jgi:hypothetical protein
MIVTHIDKYTQNKTKHEQHICSFQQMASLLHTVDVSTKKATLAVTCFWEPDAYYGALKGVIRTRVGYTGGQKENPTYEDL